MARSAATVLHGLHLRRPSRGFIGKTRSRSLTAVAGSGNTLRQRPTHNMTREVERQRPVAYLPPTKPAAAHIPPRPSSPPERTYRVPTTGKLARFSRPRAK